jgi:hypothetical protein
MDFIYTILVIVVVAFWWNHLRRRDAKAAKAQQEIKDSYARAAQSSPAPVKELTPEEAFLEEIKEAKRAAEKQVKKEVDQHKAEMQARFGKDLKLKEQLTKFAKEQELDRALIDIYDECKNYPSWSKRDDFASWNKLGITNPLGSELFEKNTQMSFEFNNQTWMFKAREWTGYQDSFLDLTFHEDGAEVFEVQYLQKYNEHGTKFLTTDVKAFQRKGNWAKTLTELEAKLEIARDKYLDSFRYGDAESIPKKFKAQE